MIASTMRPTGGLLFRCLSAVLWLAMSVNVHAYVLPDPARATLAEYSVGIVFGTHSVFTMELTSATATATAAMYSAQTSGGGTSVSTPTAITGSATSTVLGSGTPQSTTTGDGSNVDSSGANYMAVVSKWRSKGGLSPLAQDSTLEANAMKTSTNSVGGLIHELNPGTMAQVLAPGNPNDFEDVYVGGWLCEIPTLPGLDGICTTASQGWAYDGQTGHATILTSPSYTKIGCAIASNTEVWACDLA